MLLKFCKKLWLTEVELNKLEIYKSNHPVYEPGCDSNDLDPEDKDMFILPNL